jgi:hypothetical protein
MLSSPTDSLPLNQRPTGNLRPMGSSLRLISNRPLLVRSVLLLVVKPWLIVSRAARPAIAKATAGTFASSGSRSAWRREFGQAPTGKNSLSKGNNPVAQPRRTMALPATREGPISFSQRSVVRHQTRQNFVWVSNSASAPDPDDRAPSTPTEVAKQGEQSDGKQR